MAFSSTESPTEHSYETQETMFESAAEFPGHDLSESDLIELDETVHAQHKGERAATGHLAEDAEFRTDFEDYEQHADDHSSHDSAELSSEHVEPIVHTSELSRHQPLSLPESESHQGTKSGDHEVAAASPAYPNPDPDPAPEPTPTPDPDPEPPNLPLTISDFAALEDRVLRAVHLVRRERQARIAAEEQLTKAEERAGYQEGRATAAESRAIALESELLEIKTQAPILEQLQQENDHLRQEREQVRTRVERLLGQLDALEL